MSVRAVFQAFVMFWMLVTAMAQTPESTATSFGLSADEEKVLTEQANKGAGEPALRLYRFYEMVKLNHQQAIVWLRKSADNGSPQGQYILAFMYKNDPKMKDAALAKYWLEKSAKNGYEPAKQALNN